MTTLWKLLLCASVSMAVLVLVYELLLPVLGKRYKAASLYAIWLVLALGFLIPFRPIIAAPAVTAKLPARLTQPVRAAVPVWPGTVNDPAAATQAAQGANATHTTAQQTAAAPEKAPPSQAASLTLWDIITGLWILGAVATLGFYALKHSLFIRTVKRWKRPVTSAEYLQTFAQEKQRLEISGKVELYLCPSVSSPMLVGFFRPAVLLPDEALSPEELALVLSHELTHYRRRDLWVKLGLMLATAIHWFNPAAWLMARSATFYQETSCDEAVTAQGDMEDKRFYSETIIRVIRRQARNQSALSTSFYRGRNGMKRRITSIMAGGKHLGALVLTVALTLTLCTGLAFGIGEAPALPADEAVDAAADTADTAVNAAVPWDTADDKAVLKVDQIMYVKNPDASGGRLLTVPSGNDWDIPLAVYFNATPVTVVEYDAGGAVLPEWNMIMGTENNWVRVTIGGGGIESGLAGWMPRCMLTDIYTQALPTGMITPREGQSHVNLYKGFSETADVVALLPSGQQVTLCGYLDKWLHVEANGAYGFIPADSLAYDADVTAAFETFLPDIFDSFTYEDYRAFVTQELLMAEKYALYGSTNVEEWPAEGKAWFSQWGETYGGGFDNMRCYIPGKEDIQEEEAKALAWAAYLKETGMEDADPEGYEFHMYFHTEYVDEHTEDPGVKKWRIDLFPKDHSLMYFTVEISNPEGGVTVMTDMAEYKAMQDTLAEDQAYQAALSAAEAEKGSFDFWTVEEKAAFNNTHGSRSQNQLPNKSAISQEKALSIARDALMDRFGTTQAELDGWKVSYSYFIIPGYGDEQWRIGFHDMTDFLVCEVRMDAFTGEVVLASDPKDPGNG